MNPRLFILLRRAFLFLFCFTVLCGLAQAALETNSPPYLRYFGKQMVTRGVCILGSHQIEEAVFLRVGGVLDRLLEAQPQVEKNLTAIHAEIRLVGENEIFGEVPGALANEAEMKRRGATRMAFGNVTYVILPEENVLPKKLKPYPDDRDIAAHEIAHLLHLGGFSDELSRAISDRYSAVKAGGKLWTRAYALNNDREFFAELTMWYFGSHGDPGQIKPPPHSGHEWLKAYDPESYDVIDRIYQGKLQAGAVNWKQAECGSVGGLRSGNSDSPAALLVRNETAQPIRMEWVDFEGRRRSYGTILSGDTGGQDTFLTHVWVFTDPAGHDLCGGTVDSPRAMFVVRP